MSLGNDELIRYLKTAGYFKENLIMRWINLRTKVFSYLFNRNIDFNSTDEAVLRYLEVKKGLDNESSIHFAYLISISCEWDQQFTINQNDFERIDAIFLQAEIMVDGSLKNSY